jgi:hypothetical protein
MYVCMYVYMCVCVCVCVCEGVSECMCVFFFLLTRKNAYTYVFGTSSQRSKVYSFKMLLTTAYQPLCHRAAIQCSCTVDIATDIYR